MATDNLIYQQGVVVRMGGQQQDETVKIYQQGVVVRMNTITTGPAGAGIPQTWIEDWY